MQLSEHLWRVEDTCNVYVVAGPDGCACVDFGAGRALELPAMRAAGPLRDVLLTHHHRDQAQSLPLAVAAGARVWAPHAERALLDDVEAHWQARELLGSYNPRQDRFALAEPVPVAGTLRDYEDYSFAGHSFTVVPTPGHTPGSLSLLATLDGRRVAFTGDLIAGPGQLWSLAATQWSYGGGEGLAATVLSLLDLKARRLELLLPSHGEPIAEVDAAIDLTVERLWALIQARQQKNLRLFALLEAPYAQLSEHLLWNRTSMANSYALLSRGGKALLFDFGYDFATGVPAGADRAARRPWLYSIPALKARYGVTQIEAVVPTHYHDDHVAGCNLLRDREGAQVWAAESFADILERPADHDLPCLWHEPIAVERRLPLGVPIAWEEHRFTLHPLPGHTRHAVAISLEVDGRRALITGDQYGGGGTIINYVYAAGFGPDDYAASAALLRRLAPDLVLSGHGAPLEPGPGYLDALAARGEALARLHRELLPPEALAWDGGGFAATIAPYQLAARAGEPAELRVTVRNPHPRPALAEVRLSAPAGWLVPGAITLALPPHGEAAAPLALTPAGQARRARVLADITLDGRPLGQQAECLVTVRDEG
ncbi:MAG TPA: MBL fold metallo-hydrolase [Chloroflexaceae bacterium]|nr:MBL fold metallo-hydrolase [Chloroflexaceae bacterium]